MNREASEKAAAHFMAMSKKEIRDLIEKEIKQAMEDDRNGVFNWGNSIWYGQDPEGYLRAHPGRGSKLP